MNALALTKARDGRLDEAVQIATALAAAQQDYLPVQYNLAWWLAVDQRIPKQPAPITTGRLRWSASPARRLEKAMREKQVLQRNIAAADISLCFCALCGYESGFKDGHRGT